MHSSSSSRVWTVKLLQQMVLQQGMQTLQQQQQVKLVMLMQWR
jgi:predicted DNA-binding protein with PD1-like motif